VNTSQTTLTAPRHVTVPAHAARGDKTNWLFVAVLVLLFWVPDAILYMGWASFGLPCWLRCLSGVVRRAFNLLMGYTGMISFGQAAYLALVATPLGCCSKRSVGFPLPWA